MCIDYFLKDLLELLLTNMEVDLHLQFISLNLTVYETKILRNDLIKEKTSQCCINNSGHLFSIWKSLCHTHLDL